MIYIKLYKLVKSLTCILLLLSVTVVTAKDMIVEDIAAKIAEDIVDATMNNYYHYFTGLFGVIYAFCVVNKNIAIAKIETNFNSK
ncbi:hypothetical protein [Flavobacterium sp. PL12]|uniref:hypothetical protein n=1 Tax=Flavobacterium sp. PL12 TaxID=3071718 RepID=UPI00319E2C6F